MRWVVLSDLHLSFENCTTSEARKTLLDTLQQEKEQNGEFSFILLTGDCMNMHKADLESEAKYIKQIAFACGVTSEKIFMCAGNHDVDRNNTVRNDEIEKIRTSKQLNGIEKLKSGYGEFLTLYHAITGRFYKHFNVEDMEECRIITVDSSLLSKDDNDIGKLGVCFQELTKLEEKIKLDGKINILIMHHGITWLMPQDAREFQHWMARHNVNVVFCGHNHAVGLDILTEAISDMGEPQDGIKQFTCGATLFGKDVKPSFYVGNINEQKRLEVKLYTYQDNSEWKVGQNVLRSFPNGIYSYNLEQSNKKGNISTMKVEQNNIDSYDIYDSIFDADIDMASDLQNSSFLNFFGMRGGTFLKENSKSADVIYRGKKDIKSRILVSYPFCNRIEDRLKMVPDFAPRGNLEKRWKEIYEDIGRLRNNIAELENGEIRFHDQPLLYRFIMTDNFLYFGFYERKNSSQSKMFRYNSKTQMYESYRNYFESAWNQAKTKYETKIPQQYSFLEEKFDMMPSLVINLTDKCNMNCRYCPEGGENLKKCENLCNVGQIKMLMTCFMSFCKRKGWDEKKVIRITGGEPLLNENGLKELLSHAVKQGYQKVVLCTNGILLKDSYMRNKGIWENAKGIMLLKISLDSLKQNIFDQLTGTQNGYLDVVVENIKFANEKGFKIELNMVVTKDNVGEIEQIYNFACQSGLIGVKVLTINDFGNRVEPENVSEELETLIKRMRDKGYAELDLYVHNNKGILMKRFVNNGCTLTIVDHMNKANSITPRRTYGSACKNCEFYPNFQKVLTGEKNPCATGLMSLTLRADGMLSFCRLQSENGDMITNKKMQQMERIVNKQMKKFCECFHCDSHLK